MAETAKALALDADKFVSAKLYKAISDKAIEVSEDALAKDAVKKIFEAKGRCYRPDDRGNVLVL